MSELHVLLGSDLVHIPYSPDLSAGGCEYTCRWLAGSYERMRTLTAKRLVMLAGAVALELALRRYLSEQGLPFRVQTATPFSRPGQYDLRLGGHRCNLQTTLITRPGQVDRLLEQPALLLQAPALVPMDAFVGAEHRPQDLLLFAYLLGGLPAAQRYLEKARAAGQTLFLVHTLPDRWARPQVWIPLEKLTLKSESDLPFTVELAGLDAGRNYVTTRLELSPRKRLAVEQVYYSLTSLHALDHPQARIGLHSSREAETYLIKANEWKNIWIEGSQIVIAGWITVADFRRKSAVLNPGAASLPFERTYIKNLMVPMEALNPLRSLMELVSSAEIRNKPAI